MVPEDNTLQKSSLAHELQRCIFFFALKESSISVLWIAIALKNATYCAPKNAHEIVLKTAYFMVFLKNLTKNLEKKQMIVFVLIE